MCECVASEGAGKLRPDNSVSQAVPGGMQADWQFTDRHS